MKTIKLDIFITPETFSTALYAKLVSISPRFRAEYIRSLSSYAIRMESWFHLFEPIGTLQSIPLPLSNNGDLEEAIYTVDYDDIRVSVIIDYNSSPELYERLSETPSKRSTLRLLISMGYAMNVIIDNLALHNSSLNKPQSGNVESHKRRSSPAKASRENTASDIDNGAQKEELKSSLSPAQTVSVEETSAPISKTKHDSELVSEEKKQQREAPREDLKSAQEKRKPFGNIKM